jgi:hypothetical protein
VGSGGGLEGGHGEGGEGGGREENHGRGALDRAKAFPAVVMRPTGAVGDTPDPEGESHEVRQPRCAIKV